MYLKFYTGISILDGRLLKQNLLTVTLKHSIENVQEEPQTLNTNDDKKKRQQTKSDYPQTKKETRSN